MNSQLFQKFIAGTHCASYHPRCVCERLQDVQPLGLPKFLGPGLGAVDAGSSGDAFVDASVVQGCEYYATRFLTMSVVDCQYATVGS